MISRFLEWMVVTISWGWTMNWEFCFGHFEFEMTVRHSSGYLKRTERSQTVAQRLWAQVKCGVPQHIKWYSVHAIGWNHLQKECGSVRQKYWRKSTGQSIWSLVRKELPKNHQRMTSSKPQGEMYKERGSDQLHWKRLNKIWGQTVYWTWLVA